MAVAAVGAGDPSGQAVACDLCDRGRREVENHRIRLRQLGERLDPPAGFDLPSVLRQHRGKGIGDRAGAPPPWRRPSRRRDWLTAVGLGLLLIALIAAAIGAVGLTGARWELLRDEPAATALGGAALIVLVALAAYLGGGYVTGRMTRYDGARQGSAVWLCALFGTAVAGAAGAIVARQFGLLDEIEVTGIPIDERLLAAGGVVALFAIALGTRSAATLGGKAGQRYRRKVDRYGSSHPSQPR